MKLREAFRGIILATAIGVTWQQSCLLPGQTAGHSEPVLDSGKSVFLAACAGCHGTDGRGRSQSWVGFDVPLPDFTDCNASSREPSFEWAAVIHNGGPARGFSQIMPSFHEALTARQINMAASYLRGFCANRTWPQGDLNFPRAMTTEKAFPEDEAVITGAIAVRGAPAVSSTLVYERRIGARNQIEVVVPFSLNRPANSAWRGGVGDLSLGYKRVLFHNARAGSILSVSGEAILPTGNQARGYGQGVTVFETFLSYGQLLPSNWFLQLQSGVEAPTHLDNASRAIYGRAAVGRSFSQGQGLGRRWTPIVELLSDRNLINGARTTWDVVPQLQITLSRRQHIIASAGVRIPAANTSGRQTQIVFYVLWDWFDGGLREGW